MPSIAPHILIIDDEHTVLVFLEQVLTDFGYSVSLAQSGTAGIELYETQSIDLVLVDLTMPELDGTEVIRQLKKKDEDVRAICMTGTASVESAVLAMKVGALDFLSKPLDLRNLKLVLERALAQKRRIEKVKELEAEAKSEAFAGMLGKSQAMQQVFNMARRVATTNATVLILGESGTGKELLARAIHAEAFTEDRPFFTIDCANIPANLMETELFGHEKGAFTDAKKLKQGLLELADGGTLFLDEIGLMPLNLQAKLLNVFETRQFRRVGGTQQLQVSVRFLAATNEDLIDAVKEGRFREDLYYRLNVVPVRLPSLRERSGDIGLLSEHFLKVYAALHETGDLCFTTDAVALLASYPWPGNVREMRNVVERAVILADSNEINADDLAIDRRVRRSKTTSILSIDETGALSINTFPPQGISPQAIEKELIKAALEQTGGNVTQAAGFLQMSRDVLRYRMAKYAIGKEVADKDELDLSQTSR